MNRLALLAVVLATGTATAGGLSRPNNISARGVGMGGAWVAFADDSTAVYFNPAALSDAEPQVNLGAEVVIGPRSYTPIMADGTRGPAQEATVVAPLPSIGGVGRFFYNDQPSRFTLAGGLWNTYGGQIAYPKTGMKALDSTQNAVIEASAGTAFRVSDRLSIGASFRLGIGLFKVEATQNPYDAKLEANGIGVAMAWGLLFKPIDKVRIGVAWRAPLHITTTGTGTVEGASGTEQVAVEHEQDWPQSASVGVGVQATDKLKIAGQVDWTQWSTITNIVVRLPGSGNPPTIYEENWNDNWTFRLGADYALTKTVAIRGGTYHDTPAIYERVMERQYVDSKKFGFSAGTSVRRGAWRVDLAMDLVPPLSKRTVPQNDPGTPVYDLNKAPGDYKGLLFTFEAAVARVF